MIILSEVEERVRLAKPMKNDSRKTVFETKLYMLRLFACLREQFGVSSRRLQSYHLFKISRFFPL